jgi:hypothetical protein
MEEELVARATMDGKFLSIFGAEYKRSTFSGLKSELMCDLHYKNK